MRYRKPYAARHTSFSWNLIIGRNALLVAKEHGHRPSTMLTVYAAWTEGAPESDTRAIRHPDTTAAPVNDARKIKSSAAARRSITRTSRMPSPLSY